MDIQKKIELLKQVDLFSFFEESRLKELCENCTEIVLEPNEILIHEGEQDNTMYLILEGQLSIFKGIKKVALLGPGKFLGEMSLIESKPRSATVKAKTEVLLMEIDEFHFKKYLAFESKALVVMVKTLSGRIRSDLDLMSGDMQKMNIFIHDMNNFLSLLEMGVMYLENLLGHFKDVNECHLTGEDIERIKKAFKLFSGSKEGLKTLISQSLNQAKQHKIDYDRSKYRIISLVQETVQELNCHDHLKGKDIHINAIGKIPAGFFNYLDIKRVLQNLLINAGFVTKDKGTIEIRIKKHKDAIMVSVIDEGCGISEKIMPYLYKHPITTKKEGNGLGLLSCKEIVEKNHRGRFWYDTEMGKGTAFHFTIPVSKQHVHQS